MISHLQTVALIGSLRFAWPDEVAHTSAFLTVDLTWLVRPECTQRLLGSGRDRRMLISVHLFNALAVASTLLALISLRVCITWCRGQYCAPPATGSGQKMLRRRSRLEDNLDLIRSIIYELTFATTMRTLLQLMAVLMEGEEDDATVALQCAAMALLALANYLSWRADQERAKVQFQLLSGASTDRSEWSAYARQRFAVSPLKAYAGDWRQVILGQQLTLAVLSLSVDVVGHAGPVVLTHGIFALASLLATWAALNLYQPYEGLAINTGASVLTMGSILLLSLGILHEAMMGADSDTMQLPWLWAIERAMAPVVGLVTLWGGFAHLVWGLISSTPPSHHHTSRRTTRNARGHGSARPNSVPCRDGQSITLTSEGSPLHGPAATHLRLPSNARAVENAAEVQSPEASALSGALRFPDATVLYRALRPHGERTECEHFCMLFNALVTECSSMEETEQLKLIARTRAAARSRVWRCRFTLPTDITQDEAATFTDHTWYEQWTQTEDWAVLIECAMDRRLTDRAAFLTTCATPTQPSTLHVLFVFTSEKGGATISREVLEGRWSPVRIPLRQFWAQVRQDCDLLCEGGRMRLADAPRSNQRGRQWLSLDGLDHLNTYADALRAPQTAPMKLLAQLRQTCADHAIRLPSHMAERGNAMGQIRCWMDAEEESAVSGGARELSKLLAAEVHTAMLAATVDVYPGLDTRMRSAWPDEACTLEPTTASLEGPMKRILLCLRRHMRSPSSLMGIGFSVHLCRHMASARGDDTCLLQKWWLTVVDRRAESSSEQRSLVQNEVPAPKSPHLTSPHLTSPHLA